MACHRVLAAAAHAALLLACTAAAAAPAASPENLGRIIDDAVTHAPACTGLAIGAEQGNVRANRFYGDTGNRGRPTADTEFEIGSITKTLTATLLAYEDQQGNVRINDPLARFAPPGMRVPDFNGQQILMLHLADHTSGLPRTMSGFTPPLMPETMWRFVSSYPLQRAPGAQFLYSNLGFGLLARAIARRENSTEDQLYARIITQPLGMRDTAIKLSPGQQARLAQGYRPDGQPAPEGAPGFPAMDGAGAARSTLNDMMRYLDFELGKINVPQSSLLPLLHQPRHAAEPNGSVGLGWQMHERPNGLKTIFKDGAVPGYTSFMVFTPSSGSGTVILSNQTGCPVTKLGAQIIGSLNGSGMYLPELPPSDVEN
jgi:D-alanyl-D-alanine-carboxypeptidase/D-alanyl-D-alanine-endopeptidase